MTRKSLEQQRKRARIDYWLDMAVISMVIIVTALTVIAMLFVVVGFYIDHV